MLFIILAIWLGYKRAQANERNPFLWAFISAAVYMGLQLLTNLGNGFLIGLGVELFGWPASTFDDYTVVIIIVSIVVSIAGLLVVLRFLDRAPEEEVATAPPPPPTFDKTEDTNDNYSSN